MPCVQVSTDICPRLYGKGTLTPFQRLAPCSNAVFMTLAAMGYSVGAHGFVKPFKHYVSLEFS